MKKMLTESQKLFEMMEKVNPDFRKKETKTFEELSDEDKNLFNSIFKPEINFSKLKGLSAPSYDGNYMSTSKIKNWDSPEGQSLKSEIDNMVNQFNSSSSNVDLEIKNFQDYEVEDRERSYSASISFTFVVKN